MSDALPGFYGKAPALGDFVARNLPSGFLALWDRCLADIVQSSRAMLGAAWLDAWNEAPVWHFALGTGLAGTGAWAGVLIPSVDRVGRQFPFSILGPITADGDDYPDWSLRVEALALAALEDNFAPAALAAELDRLGAPGMSGFDPPAAGESVWSCRDSPMVPAVVLRFAGLPLQAEASRLVAG